MGTLSTVKGSFWLSISSIQIRIRVSSDLYPVPVLYDPHTPWTIQKLIPATLESMLHLHVIRRPYRVTIGRLHGHYFVDDVRGYGLGSCLRACEAFETSKDRSHATPENRLGNQSGSELHSFRFRFVEILRSVPE